MEQFNLEEWLKDKSRKVVTREGKDVEIIHTNSPVPHHPIVGFIDKSIYTWTIDGKLIYGKEEQDKNDLLFADEEELTEFEKELEMMMVSFSNGNLGSDVRKEMPKPKLHNYAHRLLDFARKELEKEIGDKCWEAHLKGEEALKDLPKWKKITEEKQNYLAYGYLSYDGYYLSIQELKDKLSKEE